jgi:hypothetical protein
MLLSVRNKFTICHGCCVWVSKNTALTPSIPEQCGPILVLSMPVAANVIYLFRPSVNQSERGKGNKHATQPSCVGGCLVRLSVQVVHPLAHLGLRVYVFLARSVADLVVASTSPLLCFQSPVPPSASISRLGGRGQGWEFASINRSDSNQPERHPASLPPWWAAQSLRLGSVCINTATATNHPRRRSSRPASCAPPRSFRATCSS